MEGTISKKLGVPIDSLSLISFSQHNSLPPSKTVSPTVPHDSTEAQKLKLFLPRINEFREKFSLLQEKLYPLTQQLSRLHGRWHSEEIEDMIYRTFFRELEERPYQLGDMSKIWASVKTAGVIRNRNLPCEICGENRRTEKCHIIPKALGGTTIEGNILILCPTHHSLLDSHMLSEAEWNRINWSRKREVSQLWAIKVLHVGHATFWQKQSPSCALTALDFGNHKSFALELASQLVDFIHRKGGLLQREVYKHFDPNIRVYMRTILKALISAGIVRRESDKGTYRLFIDKPPQALVEAISALHFNF